MLTLVCSLLLALAPIPEPGPHPRLLVTDQDLKQAVGSSPVTRQADSVIVAFCDGVLEAPPVTRKMVGRRLLGTSREALKRIFWLAYSFRVHGDGDYARRAIDEMLAASAFTDWNPAHFLDVGEMTMALAIGYDWLYGEMTPSERATVAHAILEKGLQPALNEDDAWFYRTEINWNSVCNAGMVYGALTVWEEDPEFCREMLEKSLESNKLAYNAYVGGGYPEGYNYWGYGTSFQIMLEAAVNDTFPSGSYPGGERTDLSHAFIRFTSTPAGNCFSFSDSYRKATGQYMQAWSSSPSDLYPEIRIMESTRFGRLCEERLFPMFLIAHARPHPDVRLPDERFFECGGTTPIFVYRSGWTSRNDTYLGVKGGLTMSSHSHCDQGSFYFESDGVTWATDLGMQNYNSLESAGVDLWDMTWESERWSVFRIGPFSHNILTVNGHVPNVRHPAAFSRTWKPAQDDGRIGAEMDLSALYAEDLDSCRRAVYLLNGDLNIVDLIEAGDSACTVRWAMCTEADASLQPGLDSDLPATPFADHLIVLESGGHRRTLAAALMDERTADFPGPGFSPFYTDYDGMSGLLPEMPDLHAHLWPTTYDPSAPAVDGMEYLHETDVPNPGTSLLGFTFNLQPHQKVVLHVRLSRVL